MSDVDSADNVEAVPEFEPPQAKRCGDEAYAAWVRHRRKVLGLTQGELGTRCRVHAQTIQGCETLRSRPGAKLRKRLAKVLGTWENIPGRAAYTWMYDDFVKNAPKCAVAVEVGVALGKSLAYLARHCLDEGRDDIQIVAVDMWAGTARNGEQQAAGPATPDGDWLLFHDIMRTNAPEELARINSVLRMASVNAACLFPDATLETGIDLVVLDAAHDYESVWADIAAWVPKIQPGGYLGGDDYESEYQGVIDAVDHYFPHLRIEVKNQYGWGTWRVRIEEGDAERIKSL